MRDRAARRVIPPGLLILARPGGTFRTRCQGRQRHTWRGNLRSLHEHLPAADGDRGGAGLLPAHLRAQPPQPLRTGSELLPRWTTLLAGRATPLCRSRRPAPSNRRLSLPPRYQLPPRRVSTSGSPGDASSGLRRWSHAVTSPHPVAGGVGLPHKSKAPQHPRCFCGLTQDRKAKPTFDDARAVPEVVVTMHAGASTRRPLSQGPLITQQPTRRPRPTR